MQMRDGATMIGKDETRENGYLGEGIGRRGLGSWRYVFTSLAVLAGMGDQKDSGYVNIEIYCVLGLPLSFPRSQINSLLLLNPSPLPSCTIFSLSFSPFAPCVLYLSTLPLPLSSLPFFLLYLFRASSLSRYDRRKRLCILKGS
uniref:Uncharacterized protein n=1 Tax=Amorphochlora amoebiformis TaxID=1561963 RepID=A0A7S0H723_9EUKA